MTVTFNTNGGNEIKAMQTDKLCILPNAEKAGCTFDGWYLDSSFKNQVVLPMTLSENITLHAKFTQQTVTVKYYHDGKVFSSLTVNSDSKITKPTSTPTKNKKGNISYEFEGWKHNGVLFNFENDVVKHSVVDSLYNSGVIAEKAFILESSFTESASAINLTEEAKKLADILKSGVWMEQKDSDAFIAVLCNAIAEYLTKSTLQSQITSLASRVTALEKK